MLKDVDMLTQKSQQQNFRKNNKKNTTKENPNNVKTLETCCGRRMRSAVCDKRAGGAEEGSARVGGRKSASRVTAERRVSESG